MTVALHLKTMERKQDSNYIAFLKHQRGQNILIVSFYLIFIPYNFTSPQLVFAPSEYFLSNYRENHEDFMYLTRIVHRKIAIMNDDHLVSNTGSEDNVELSI